MSTDDNAPYKISYTGFALNGSTLPSTPVMTRRATSKMKVRGSRNAENTVRMLREAGYRNVTMKAAWW